ncbi:MAG TPA: BlaI/MecI/CopY family transcriptional regulator [Gemmatirosa sp.]
MSTVTFTDRELDVMTVLWAAGPSTVADVRESLAAAGHDLAYTTVLTVLRTLEAKGHVAHEEEGRAHRYRPLVEREAAGRSALRRLLGTVFGGSPELLLTHLVGERGVSEDELRRMRALLDERLGGAPAAPEGAADIDAEGNAGPRTSRRKR